MISAPDIYALGSLSTGAGKLWIIPLLKHHMFPRGNYYLEYVFSYVKISACILASDNRVLSTGATSTIPSARHGPDWQLPCLSASARASRLCSTFPSVRNESVSHPEPQLSYVHTVGGRTLRSVNMYPRRNLNCLSRHTLGL